MKNEQRDIDKNTSVNDEREGDVNKNEGANVINGRPIDISKESATTVNKHRPSMKEKTGTGENDEISSVGAQTEAK